MKNLVLIRPVADEHAVYIRNGRYRYYERNVFLGSLDDCRVILAAFTIIGYEDRTFHPCRMPRTRFRRRADLLELRGRCSCAKLRFECVQPSRLKPPGTSTPFDRPPPHPFPLGERHDRPGIAAPAHPSTPPT